MPSFYRPPETAEHAGCIMSWPTRSSIMDNIWPYPGSNVEETRADIARLAKTIAKYEPVHLFVADPASIDDDQDSGVLESAQKSLEGVEGVTIHITPNVDCLWARDTGPMFVRTTDGSVVSNSYHENDEPGAGFRKLNTATSTVGLQLNFNQWGRKETPTVDTYFAATASQTLNKSCVLAPFVAEGGGIEVDGEGTFMATESCFLNPNRNPGISRQKLEEYISEAMGIKHFIWIPGVRGADITDDHIDALARFTELPGTVLLTKPYASHNDHHRLKAYREARDILGRSVDALGRAIKIVEVEEPDPVEVFGETHNPASGHCVAYVNFLVGNGAVFMSKFGNAEKDAAAAKTVAECFPSRTIEQIELLQIGRQGGGIHCSTQHIFA